MKLIFSTVIFMLPMILHAEGIESAYGFLLGEVVDMREEKFSEFLKKDNNSYIKYDFTSKTIEGEKFSELILSVNSNNEIYSINELVYLDSNKCKRIMPKIADGISKHVNRPLRKENLGQYTINDKNRHMEMSCEMQPGKRGMALVTNLWDDKIKVTSKGSANAASSKITGAFGFQFGEKIDLSRNDYAVVETLGNGTPISIDFHKNLQKPFSYYRVMLNPKNAEIYAIGASAQFQTLDECVEDMVAYGKDVEDKYNKL